MSRSRVVRDYGLARSKWKQYLHFHADHVIDKNTPHTAILNKSSLQQFLQLYSIVFLKPVHGGKGRGVCKVSQHGGKYLLHVDQKIETFHNIQSLYKSIKSTIGRERYVIQQGISILSLQNRPIDFRILLIKRNGKWDYIGTIGKLAARNKVVTNYSRGGRAITLPQLFSHLQSPELGSDYKGLEAEFEKIGLYMAKTHFNYGKMLGLDVAVDRNKKLWVLEGNTRPGIRLFKYHQDKSLYQKIRQTLYH